MNEDEQNNRRRESGIPINFGMSFEDFVLSIPSNLRKPILFNFPTAYKYVGLNGETNVITPEVVITPMNNGPKLTYLEYMLNKKLKESLKGRDTAGKIGTIAMAAGVTPVMLGTTSYVLPQLVNGLTTFGRFMTPSSHLAIFGTGPYNTALGGTNASTAGAIADNALFSLGATSALKTFEDNPNIFNGINTALASTPVSGVLSGGAKVKALKVFERVRALQLMNKTKEAREFAKAELGDVLDGKSINMLVTNINDFYKTEGKYYRTLQQIFNKVGNKYKKGSNIAINAANELDTANDPAKAVERIRQKYAGKLEQDGISWDDQIVMPSRARLTEKGLPLKLDVDNFNKFLISPVGFDKETPFLERYYNNVINKILGENGLLKKLLKEGKLKRNERGQWVGLNDEGKYVRVEPLEYIKSLLQSFQNLNQTLPEYETGIFNYPVHGTRDTDIRYLTKPSDVPGYIGIMTVIDNDRSGAALMIDKYRGSGYSFPFYPAKKDLERVMEYKGGINNSNSVHGTGRNAPTVTNENPTKATRIDHLSDPSTTGQQVDEYNFGHSFKNLKSKYNTLDFEPGAGPFAFNYIKKDSNINFA